MLASIATVKASEESSSSYPTHYELMESFLPLNLPADLFDTIADRLLVNVEPDVIHMFVAESPWLFL